jgi:uncharacterized Tic20 family protein
MSTAPPGWYHDGLGVRWWDGTSWGSYAQGQFRAAQTEEEAGRNAAMLSHAGAIAGGFIIPLCVYLTQRDHNRFAAFHAAEALNFQITLAIAVACLWVPYMVSFVQVIASQSNELPWGIWLLPAVAALWLVGLGFSIMGAVRASQGRRWRYPIRIPFVRAHLADG